MRLSRSSLLLLLLPFGIVGRSLLHFLETLGRVTAFGMLSLSHLLRPPLYMEQIRKQLIETGYYSLPVVALTVTFSGMVLVLQSYAGFENAFATRAIPELVVLAITRELAPVLSGLMVAGRVGGAMAAEIATMRVSEQIDALETLSANPYKYLIVPRLLALRSAAGVESVVAAQGATSNPKTKALQIPERKPVRSKASRVYCKKRSALKPSL